MSTKTSRYQPPSSTEELILAWLRRARESQLAHYEMATALHRLGSYLGVPVIIITAVVGTSVFTSISTSLSLSAALLIGLSSILATILSSLQTFFKFSERSESHRAFGAKFGSLRRELEGLHVSSHPPDERSIDLVRQKIDRLAEEAPAVPKRVFANIQKQALFVDESRTP